jgi:hypothetical protein
MKKGGIEHPKTRNLSLFLKISKRDSVGLLEMLFAFTAEYAPRGDIGRCSNEAIAEAVHWPKKKAQQLVDGLVNCGHNVCSAGYLEEHPEHRLIVHDWAEHAPEFIKKKLLRAKQEFVKPVQTLSRQRPDNVQTSAGGCPDNGGPPSLAVPSLASPVVAVPSLALGTTDKAEAQTAAPCPKSQQPEKKLDGKAQFSAVAYAMEVGGRIKEKLPSLSAAYRKEIKSWLEEHVLDDGARVNLRTLIESAWKAENPEGYFRNGFEVFKAEKGA